MGCLGGKFLLRAVLPFILFSNTVLLFSQSPGPTAGGSAPSAGAAGGGGAGVGTGGGMGTPGGTGSRGTTGNNGSIYNNNRNTNPMGQQMPSPIFLSGRVMMDDGTPPDRDIRIERVCGGIAHSEGHADSKGRFSFQLGQNSGIDMDASESGIGGRPGSMGAMTPGMAGYGDRNGTNLWNCELRASYPGYRSDIVQLGGRRALDSPDVGTIVLHRLGNVQGTTISLTTALAPKDARKEYEKGLQLAQKGKFDEAMLRLSKATDLYPKYAIAWYALGQLQQKNGRSTDARSAYEKALAADPKYVSPLNQLALLAAQDGKWEDAATLSKQAISLNPVEFPSAFWYNALANYNLKRTDAALQSTKDLLKLDTRHNLPEAENLMAQLLLDSGNYPEAANHLRSYLTLVPNAKNADALKQMLLKIEAAKATPPAPAASAPKP
jgi:tetratricopeptide (TPR) repeat protein